MELSTPLGSSLATPAAMALLSPNPKVSDALNWMLPLEAGASSACLQLQG